MGMEGHNVIAGMLDEFTVWVQPELPLAEAALEEHKRETGHNPLKVSLPVEGWICTHFDEESQTSCISSWPPPTPAEKRYEEAMANLLRTGRHKVAIAKGVEAQISFPVVGPDLGVLKVFP